MTSSERFALTNARDELYALADLHRDDFLKEFNLIMGAIVIDRLLREGKIK